MRISHRIYGPLVVGCLWSVTGCDRNKAVSADPDIARATLKEGLEAWQAGQETPEAFKLRTNIQMVERRWTSGVKLVVFEIPTDSSMVGFDWACTVKTTIKTADGKTVEEKALYSVSTHPQKVIVRTEN